MSNIQKAFDQKRKCGLRMALGGIVGDEANSTLGKAFNEQNNQWAANVKAQQQSPAQGRQFGADVSGVMPGQAGYNPMAQMDSTGTKSGQWGFDPSLVAPNDINSMSGNAMMDLAARPQQAQLQFQNPGAPSMGYGGGFPTVGRGLRGGVGNSRSRFEVGGIVGPDGLTDSQRASMARSRGSLGVSNAPVQQAPVQQAPVQQAPTQRAPVQPTPSIGEVINGIRQRHETLRSLANGGVVGARSYEFEGKGTGTSDDIPMKVAGQNIHVSDGEKAVVLPAKTAQNPHALDMIEDVIQATNDGRQPNRGLRDGTHANVGGFTDDFGNLINDGRFKSPVQTEIRAQQLDRAAPGAQLSTAQTNAMTEEAAANRAYEAQARSRIPPKGTLSVGPTAPAAAAADASAAANGMASRPLPSAAAAAAPGVVRSVAGHALRTAGTVGRLAAPAIAAYDATLGDDAITVNGNREGDPGRDEMSGLDRAGAAAKELGLKAVDWATRGTDMLIGNPAVWLRNASTNGNVPYDQFNNTFRQGMRDSEIKGANIPTRDGSAPAPVAPAAIAPVAPSTPEQQAAARAAMLRTPPAPGTGTKENYVPEATNPTPKLDAEVARRGLSNLRTESTPSGNVTSGRDKRGQLHVMAGLDNTDARNEELRSKEADRINADLTRQKAWMAEGQAQRLMDSNDPADKAMGLQAAQRILLERQGERTAAASAAQYAALNADAKEGRAIQREQLAQQGSYFDKNFTAQQQRAQAAEADARLTSADDLIEKSGYKDDALTAFRDSVRLNVMGGKTLPDGRVVPTTADFDKMSKAEQRKVLPVLKAAHEYTKVVNKAAGTESAEFPELLKERPMEFGKDVGTDPDSRLGLPRWNSSPDGSKHGMKEWLQGKFDPIVDTTMYEFNNGRTVRKSAIKGNMGPLGGADMSAQRTKQLKDNASR